MVWTAILVTLAVAMTVVAFRRCRQANKLIERILVEELSAPRPVVPMVPFQESAAARLEMDLLGVDRV
jgi:hypothetical protein